MSPFDPGWFLVTWRGRVRRNETRLAARGRGKVRRRLGRLAQGLSGLGLRLMSPWRRPPWWTDKETARANQERRELLKALAGRVHMAAGGAKLYTGTLSPGCQTCMDGTWGCNYVNGRCNRNCFYCTRPHTMPVEPDAQSDSFHFKSTAEHVAFVKTFGVRGVGFTGGEPLMALDRLLEHITALRQAFGPSLYLWMYTNGDLVTEPKLERLRQAGLDEMRLDLTARAYDLAPLRLAVRHIPTVTVEIPAIPEDFERLKRLLVELQEAGVRHLNIHDLMAGQPNWRTLWRRGYHFSSQGHPTVNESELCILRLLLYACEQGITLPINYCAVVYRLQFYARALRARAARINLEGFREVTEAGYLRSLQVTDTAEKIAQFIRRLQADHVDAHLWQAAPGNASVTLHSRLARYVDWPSARLSISYLEPRLKPPEDPTAGFDPARLETDHRPVRTVTGLGLPAFHAWHRLYVNHEAAAGTAVSESDLRQLLPLARLENMGGELPEFG